jgi:hypothetical protein
LVSNCSYNFYCVAGSNNLNQDTPVLPTVSTLKKDGKKRAVDDDGDATASEEEGASATKGTKKKKTQHK